MIKLIASDIDDTLLPYATPYISGEIADLIRELKRRNVRFVVTTGRELGGVLETFFPVKDDIIVVSDNGAKVSVPGRETTLWFLNPADYKELLSDYRSKREYGRREFIVSTAEREVLIEDPSQEFLNVVEGMKLPYHIVDRIPEEGLSVLKISIWDREGVDELSEELIPKWKKRVNICKGGRNWLPSMHIRADKGLAVRDLMEYYGIKKDEVMVFGDSGNDVGMFEVAGRSFAVEDAEPFVLSRAKEICPSSAKNGVYHTIVKEVL